MAEPTPISELPDDPPGALLRRVADALLHGVTDHAPTRRRWAEGLIAAADALDARTRALAECREWRDVWGPDVALWGHVYAMCSGELSDADLAGRVRQMARDYYRREMAKMQGAAG